MYRWRGMALAGIIAAACSVSDIDEDGFSEPEDCDDLDPDLNPDQREACDGIDNNCNGQVDEGVTTTVYDDADGDGYGDPDTAREVCEVGPGDVLDNTDCDDTRPRVYPFAPERCNALDDDCNPDTPGGRGAYFEGSDGNEVLIALDADPADPVNLKFDQDGTAHFCRGTYLGMLSVEGADVTIEGNDQTGVIFDGRLAAGPVLTVEDGQAHVVGATLQVGRGQVWRDGKRYGGVILCTGADSAVELTNGFLNGGDANRGGALAAIDGCEATVSDTTIAQNDVDDLGGALYLAAGTHRITDSVIALNRSTHRAGGAHIGPDATVSFEGVELRGHTGPDGAAGVQLVDSDLTWTSTGTMRGVNRANQGGSGAGLYLDNSTVTVTDVDFGQAGGANDNRVDEIVVVGLAGAFSADDAATFSCDRTGCGETAVHSVGTGSATAVVGGTFSAATVFTIDAVATLADLEVFAGSTGSCEATAFVLGSLGTPGRGTRWTLFGGYNLDVDGELAWRSTSRIGLVLQPGWSYAVGVRSICDEGGQVSLQRGDTTGEILPFARSVAWARGETADIGRFSSYTEDDTALSMRLRVTRL